MTDNGSCYRSKLWAKTRRDLGINHIRTKPYTPQTNGKAGRFIQTAIREWAYATAFKTSDQRRDALPEWQHRYNWHRPHARAAGAKCESVMASFSRGFSAQNCSPMKISIIFGRYIGFTP